VKSTQKITKGHADGGHEQDAPRAGAHEAWRAPYADKIRAVIGHLNEAKPRLPHPFLVHASRSRWYHPDLDGPRLAGGLNAIWSKRLCYCWPEWQE